MQENLVSFESDLCTAEIDTEGPVFISLRDCFKEIVTKAVVTNKKNATFFSQWESWA